MARHRSSAPLAQQSPAQARRHDTPITLDAFVSTVYLPHVKVRKRSWRVDERIARQHLSPAFGDRRLADIQRHEVEDWLHGLSEKGLAPATCNRILAVFKTICSLAEVRGVLPAGQSPCAGVASFKIHAQRERYLTREEAQRLMRALEKSERPEALALRLLLLTGARKSEILKAQWENIRLDLRLLIVPLSKSGKPRHIPLSDEVIAVIRAIPRQPGNPWLFPGRAPGKPLSALYLFWNMLRHELGLADVRIHDLRHTPAYEIPTALDLVLTTEQMGYFVQENTVQLRQTEVNVGAYHHAIAFLADKSLSRKGLEIAVRRVVFVQVLREILPAELLVDLQPVIRDKESKDGVVPCNAGIKGVIKKVQGIKNIS